MTAPVGVRGYCVYPPDETSAVFVALPTQACSANGVNPGSVTTVVTGASPRPLAIP